MIPGNGIGGVVASVGVETDERLVGKRVVASTGGSGGDVGESAFGLLDRGGRMVRFAHAAIESRATVGKTLLVT